MLGLVVLEIVNFMNQMEHDLFILTEKMFFVINKLFILTLNGCRQLNPRAEKIQL